jgi:hypothetical protein
MHPAHTSSSVNGASISPAVGTTGAASPAPGVPEERPLEKAIARPEEGVVVRDTGSHHHDAIKALPLSRLPQQLAAVRTSLLDRGWSDPGETRQTVDSR